MINKRTKKFLLFMLVALVIALAIRLAVSADLYSFNYGRNAVQTPPATTDMATYMELSQKIGNGTYSGEFNYQPFYYVVALPIVNFICGRNLWGVIWFQALLGAITCLLTGLCAAEFCGRRGGYIAAGLTIFCGIMICYTPFHLIATLQACWIVLVLYAAILALKRDKLIYWGLVGLISGCAILTRGNIWFFLPGLVVVAIYSGFRTFKNSTADAGTRHNSVTDVALTKKPASPEHRTPNEGNIQFQLKLKAVLPLVLLILFVILPQIPFAWHNSVVKGHLSGPSTAADQVLALGNTKESPPGGRNPEYLAGPMEYPPSYGLWMSNRDKISVPRRIINWFTEQPAAYIELSFRKLLLFWDYREIPNNISYDQARQMSPWLTRLGFISSGLIIVFALAGLLLWIPRLRYNIKLLLLYYFIIAYWGGTAAFYILARFRMPLIPLLAIASAMGVEWIIRHRKHGSKAWLTALAAFIVGYFICYQAYDLYRHNLEASFIRLTRPAGIKVKMAPGSYMLLDNGPMTFGGWGLIPLNTNILINKTFADLPTAKITGMKFELPLVAGKAGSAVIAINGKQEFITFTKPGMQKFTFDLSPVGMGKVKVQFVGGIPLSVIMDYQRDYGRTVVNGKSIQTELVCRLFCEVTPVD
jgi:Dolichyl-phosphate-mannose-protein mannosyltransferase